MAHYIALIHKERDSSYGVSFPDVPGVTAAGDSLDAAVKEASEALDFATEEWESMTGDPFPAPRTIDELRRDREFLDAARDAILVAVPLRAAAEAV